MANTTSRWANQPTVTVPYPPYRDSEKGEESPLLGYEASHVANLASPPHAASSSGGPKPRRRCVRAAHFLLLTALLTFAAHFVFSRYKGSLFQWVNKGSLMNNDCVEQAHWVNHDEELDQHHWHGFRHLTKTSFNLPVDSELLYFLARGSLSHGAIEFKDDGDSDSDNAVVDVSFMYIHDVALENVEVCRLQRDGSKNGVGIFSPNLLPPHRHDEYRSHFSVVVHLPNGSGNKHTYEALETDLPIFVHIVGDLDRSASFRSLQFHTTNAPIRIESLTVENGQIQTTNGPIEGSVTSSSKLDVKSTNGPIKTDVILSNEGGTEASKLVLSTSNSIIHSSISLISLTEDGTGGSFNVDAHTSNGPIDISFPTAPVDSILNFDAHSSNSPVHAFLHKTYEGTYDLKTSFFAKAALDYDNGVEDPAGKGRHRVVETYSVGKGTASGKVTWRDAQASLETGSVKLSSSNAGVSLRL